MQVLIITRLVLRMPFFKFGASVTVDKDATDAATKLAEAIKAASDTGVVVKHEHYIPVLSEVTELVKALVAGSIHGVTSVCSWVSGQLTSKAGWKAWLRERH